MILFDLNQLLISSLFAQTSSNPNIEITEDLVRHIALSSILHYKKKFGYEYGELVFCADDKNYWRKELFPYYKAGRKKSREKSGFDWAKIFECMNLVRSELREYFPYKVVQVPTAEADDIIAVLAKWTQTNGMITNRLEDMKQQVLIVSSDKDYMQLQKYDNIKQYAPLQKKFLYTDKPAMFLKEHIIRGDDGDGIPNYLSDDDTFVMKEKRQTPIRQVKVDVWLTQDPEVFCDKPETLAKYRRNEQLIDFKFIPPTIEDQIVAAYEVPIQGHGSKLLNYFMKNKLKQLMEDINEF